MEIVGQIIGIAIVVLLCGAGIACWLWAGRELANGVQKEIDKVDMKKIEPGEFFKDV